MMWLILSTIVVSALPEMKLRRQVVNETLQKRSSTHSDALYNMLGIYTLEFKLGNPPQLQQAILDTGSSDLYVMGVGAFFCREDISSQGLTYDPSISTTSQKNETLFKQLFVDGDSAEGIFMHDTIHIAGVQIGNFSFGVAEYASSNLPVLGIGMVAEEIPLVRGYITEPYANLPVMFKNSGEILHISFSLWLNSWRYDSGTILFGGLDVSKMRSILFRFPFVDSLCGSKTRYSVKLNALYLVSSDNTQQLFARTSIPIDFDSGTSVSRLPTQLIKPLFDGMGAVYSDISRSFVVACNQLADGGGIGIVLSGVEVVMAFRDIAVPLSPDYQWCIPGFMEGDAVIGANILRSLYVVHDIENLELGVAMANTAASVATAEHNYYTLSSGIPIGYKAPWYSQSSCSYIYTTWQVVYYGPGVYPQTPLSSMIYPFIGNAAVSGFQRPAQWI